LDGAGCELCHGLQAIGGPGSVPDLRRTDPSRWALFSEIVRGGYFTSSGMPNFSDVVQDSDIPALKAYIMDKAWQGYEQQKTKGSSDSSSR
jgi:quinohemoprotein ethanol dehydrogenase